MATFSQAQTQIASRLAPLYQRLTEAQVDAYLVPSSDTHLNEYVPEYQRRRAAISGFTGSAGALLIGPDRPTLFTDRRYTLQSREEAQGARVRISRGALDSANAAGCMRLLDSHYD